VNEAESSVPDVPLEPAKKPRGKKTSLNATES
jgi:hypothetical protein